MRKIVDIPGSILKELRTSHSIPESVAAEKLKIEVGELRSWEKEGVAVTVSQARKIARISKRKSWAILLLGKVPIRKDLSKKYRRFKQHIGNYSISTVLAFRNAERILQLAETIEGRLTNKEQINAFDVRMSSDIETLTERVRKWLGISIMRQKKFKGENEALLTWTREVESKGIYVSEVKMELKEARAFTLSDSKRSVIILNRADTVKGRIFSLLHELAHILLDRDSTFDIYEGYNFKDKVEVFCNKFAGNVLVPTTTMSKNAPALLSGSGLSDSIHEMSQTYKVSTYVILRRLYDMQYINRSRYENLSSQFEQAYAAYVKKHKDDPFYPPKSFHEKSVIRKNSPALVQDVLEAYRSKHATYYDVASYLAVKSKYITAIEQIVSYE